MKIKEGDNIEFLVLNILGYYLKYKGKLLRKGILTSKCECSGDVYKVCNRDIFKL